VTLRLAEDIDAQATRLRLAYSATEIAALEVELDDATTALEGARGVEHGADIDRRLAAVMAAQAALDHANEYSDPITGLRAGQLVRLGESLLEVRHINTTFIEVERGANGAQSSPHVAGTELLASPSLATSTIEVIVDGAGAAIEPGEKAEVLVPFAGRVDRVRLIADQVGSAVVDIVRSTFTDPPGSGTSITAAAKPELATAARYDDAVLTDWTRDLDVDDVLGVIVEEATDVERLTLVLTVAV